MLDHVSYLWDENVEDHFDEETIKEWSESHGRGGPGEEDPGPPSDPGSPYDTIEEKRGLK
jgi:hypothetical protein